MLHFSAQTRREICIPLPEGESAPSDDFLRLAVDSLPSKLRAGDSEGPVYSWAPSAYQAQPWEPEEKPPVEQDIGRGPADYKEVNQHLEQAGERLESGEPLDIKIKVPLLAWDGEVEKDQWSKYLGKYFCTIDLQVEKTESKREFVLPGPVTQGQITLKSARFAFTGLATYGEIFTDYSLAFTEGEEDNQGFKLAFEMVDGQGNIVSPIGCDSSGEYGEFVWWPAVKKIPKSVTVRVRQNYTGEILGTFDLPLEEASQAASGAWH